MSEHILYLILALTASVSVNAFLFWFARKSSSRLTIVASNIDEIMTALENFESHLETIYEMETFYGDETLHGVLKHARGLVEFLSEFEDIYELLDEFPDEADEEWEEPDDREKSSAIASTAKEEKKKTTKKVVFHSGT
tara:strand:- start:131 stop:544 length:414 start_codon:yes stop_codon:yes gene_type:complete